MILEWSFLKKNFTFNFVYACMSVYVQVSARIQGDQKKVSDFP